MLSPSGVYLRKNAKRKYDAILKSACRLFLKQGYTRTNMDSIAVDAGVSKQTVYSYFTNKDVLFSRMIEDEYLRHRPADTMLDNPALKPEDGLFRIGRGFLDTICSHRGLTIYRLAIAEAERHPRVAKMFFDAGPLKVQAQLVDYLRRQIKLGVFAIGDAEAAATEFFSLIRGPHQLRALLKIKPAPGHKELDAHARAMVQLFCRLYRK